ncbi:hypothetical protein ACE10X_27230 [Bradyrhizobium sp. Pha-3]|uniref:hypothetical protein n=1 Tax=Bradyrhizobium sp. Pha-3 TaxID=208375 RepID=UPI0035D4264F
MIETFLSRALHQACVDRLIPVAGQGDVDLIHRAVGPLLLDRPGLAERLAELDGCPFSGVVTVNEIKIALGEFGDIWPTSIWPHVMTAGFD